MISVIISKIVGDALGGSIYLSNMHPQVLMYLAGKDGIYTTWIQLRGYPSLPNGEFRDEGKTAASVMVPARKIFCVGATSTLGELGRCYVITVFPKTLKLTSCRRHGHITWILRFPSGG
jgi:hypothetical protein